MKKKGGKGKVVDTAEFVTAAEAAEMRGVSRAAIHELIKRGRLRAERLFGRVLLYRSEVEAFERRKPGPKSADQLAGKAR